MDVLVFSEAEDRLWKYSQGLKIVLGITFQVELPFERHNSVEERQINLIDAVSQLVLLQEAQSRPLEHSKGLKTGVGSTLRAL